MSFLTVAIPTFNRLEWLKRSLPIVLEQAARLPPGEVDVLVSDNCSSDGTDAYLKEAQQQYSFLRLNRNLTNIGAEANFFRLPQLAQGDCLFMIGDDDLLEPGALAAILEALHFGYEYVVVNHSIYDKEFERCLNSGFIPIKADHELNGARDCYRYTPHVTMGFIGAWAGRREFFNIINEKTYQQFARWGMSIMVDRYVGTAKFSHGKIIAQPLVRARRHTVDNPSEHNFDYFEWFLCGGAEVLDYAVRNVSMPGAVARRRKGWMLRHIAWKRILVERSQGRFKAEHVYALLRKHYEELAFFWLICVPLIFLPGLGTLTKSAVGLLDELKSVVRAS